ncbi:hypothetical protein RvY_18344-2 [Ramazzottius varieornatus]|uniref:Aldehyde dehydrogenase n=1 Tax=Ramazzottius varieornatus TaxID=947166 RepID=A0A1D1W5E3_RAMVA|nr:hypothetical protein RvY_18344-2 [Ramazzottius varieornatus]
MPSTAGKGVMLHGVEDNTALITDTVQKLRRTFQSGKTRPYEFRKKQLEGLLKFLNENVDLLCDALWKDLHKPRQECIVTEIEITKNEILVALANLKKWMSPKPTEKSLATLADYPFIQHEPYGVVMIIGAWNYPVNLLLGPLVGAIGAGNCVLIKPSEVAENLERTIYEMLPNYIDQDCYIGVCAGPEGTSAILKHKFDYIFYTGSTTVGKIVYEAAAKHLTPVTLELGGKSPVWVDETSDMTLAARRIMWGKLINAGQTCIAPDYVMCTAETQGELIKAMKTAVREFLGDNPGKSKDFCHIISTRQFDRLRKLLTGQNVAFGGDFDVDQKYIAPTVLSNVGLYSEVMKSEIFGPILPIVPVGNADTAIRFVNEGEKPLALYVFSKDDRVSERFLKETTSGGACINDTIMHIAAESLPFGGVGASGTGAYHGFYSFETFSHKRAVLWKKHGWDFLFAMRYPPYSDFKTNGLAFLMRYRRPLPAWLNKLVIFGLGLATGYAARYLANQPTASLHQQDRSDTVPHGGVV